MADAKGLTRKIGPLPLWAWGVLGGIAVYILYVRHKNATANQIANSPTSSVLDPNAIDPTTGLTYGQELAGSYPINSGASGSGDSGIGGTGATSAYDPNAIDPITGLTYGEDASIVSQIQGAVGTSPSLTSNSTAAAAASPALQNTSPPGYAQKDRPYLAPGASAPNYLLTPPKGAPGNARWSGPAKPPGNWRGIGGGWWVPTSNPSGGGGGGASHTGGGGHSRSSSGSGNRKKKK